MIRTHLKHKKASLHDASWLFHAESLSYLSSHAHTLAAGLLATAAGFGALLAMRGVGTVLFALVAAGLADFGALLQQVGGVLRAAGHEAGGQGADVGAIPVEANTAGHHFYILLAEAGGGAMLARGDAGVEGIEETLVLSVHGKED